MPNGILINVCNADSFVRRLISHWHPWPTHAMSPLNEGRQFYKNVNNPSPTLTFAVSTLLKATGRQFYMKTNSAHLIVIMLWYPQCIDDNTGGIGDMLSKASTEPVCHPVTTPPHTHTHTLDPKINWNKYSAKTHKEDQIRILEGKFSCVFVKEKTNQI